MLIRIFSSLRITDTVDKFFSCFLFVVLLIVFTRMKRHIWCKQCDDNVNIYCFRSDVRNSLIYSLDLEQNVMENFLYVRGKIPFRHFHDYSWEFLCGGILRIWLCSQTYAQGRQCYKVGCFMQKSLTNLFCSMLHATLSNIFCNYLM